ncbi:MAG: lysophospholipid acyltransferase family protein [Calditrichaeota bacterium]|nr:lysophospholipid acyltransferase family protein [Calditrichota bacterium]MCB9369167.1 lysophospholipid acyltransferase family protein [Calditrichota bacterium]
MKARKPLVMVTWHGRLLGSTYHCRKRNVVAMISQHRDGELVSQVVEKIGYETVRGSSTRGGSTAALAMIEKVRAGQTAAMIGDGPRGPIYKLKDGAAYISINSGADVIPVIFAADRTWVFRSWDRFTLPKPFSRVFLYYGEPIPHPGESADVHEFTLKIEAALEELREKAETEARAA